MSISNDISRFPDENELVSQILDVSRHLEGLVQIISGTYRLNTRMLRRLANEDIRLKQSTAGAALIALFIALHEKHLKERRRANSDYWCEITGDY